MRKRFLVGLTALAIVVVGFAIARPHELLRWAIERGAAVAGYSVGIGDLEINASRVAIGGLDVQRNGLPLLRAARIGIRYSLRDLLPGSRHRLGLLEIDASGLNLTLTRFRDGSFNLSVPRGAGGPSNARANPVPFHFAVHLRDVAVELREPTAFDPSARSVRVERIDGDALVNSAALTRYRVTGAFAQDAAAPFSVAGKIDPVAGYAIHHARAARIPLAGLANYFAQTPNVRVLRGQARDLDAVIYALGVTPDAAPRYHATVNLNLQDGALALDPLVAPVDGIRAKLHVVDTAFFVSDASATLAGIPLRFDGGIYDLDGSLTGGPKLRVGVRGAGDLASLRHAFSFTQDQPLAGRTQLGVLVEGPLTDPVIVAHASSPRAYYRELPFDALRADVVYHAGVVALLPVEATYGGIAVALRGTLSTGTPLRSELAVHVAGSAQRLPYLDEMLGDEPIAMDAIASGRDLLFHVLGGVASTRGSARMAALVEMDGNGTARIDPFWLHTDRGDLAGAYILDRPQSNSAFWMSSSKLRMHAPKYPAFPGLSLPQMPKIDGGTMQMTVAGGGSGANVYLGGTVSGENTTIAGVPFDTVRAAIAGTLAQSSINRLTASGPWGNFDGHGEFTTQQFVAAGAYRGTLDGLQPFLGNAITGHGALAGPVAIAVQARRILVQGTDLQMPGATLRGIPVDRASLTLAVEGNRLRIYSATAAAAGGDVVAAGTVALGPASVKTADRLSLIATHLRGAQLKGIGLPMSAGTLSASGDFRAGAPLPSFDGGIAIRNGRIAGFPISGDGDIALAGDAVALRRVIGSLGGAYAHVDGSIGSLTSNAPTYALDAHVPAARVAATLRAFSLPNYLTDGSFNADLRVGGASVNPTIVGRVAVPAGEVNGLPFIDGSALLDADTKGVAINHGAVRIGTTFAHFSAIARPHENSIRLRARHADLSDFNNFFDTGDTLDGNGRLQFAAASQGSRISSSGDIDVTAFRYRNLPIGDTRAVWSSARNVVGGDLAVGGEHGRLSARGSIALTPAQDWLATLERSRFDLTTSLRDLDLSLWLPALGMQSVPVTGHASGDATVRGRFPQLDVRSNASITGGSLGPLTLDTADVAMRAHGGRILIEKAEMATSDLTASASGSFGLNVSEPLDLHVYVATDRLAQLVYDAARFRVPVSGSFESTLAIDGTLSAPRFLAGFDATDVSAYGIPASSLFGEVRLDGRALVLSNAGVTFGRGEATLAGSLPLSLAPLRFAAADSPLSFDVDVVGLDPSPFDATLGSNTKMTGLIDGHLGLSGTVAQPVILGRLALTRGSYVSDLERVPITGMNAILSFNRTAATIEQAVARAGTGTIRGSGSVDFPSGFTGGGSSMSLQAQARGAVFDLPAFGSGTVDAHLALRKQANATALLSGNVSLRNAVLPFSSFVKAAGGGGSFDVPQLPLAFDVLATAGKNVRVRGSGYGAGLDIGATGHVRLAGTLASPTLAGTFKSTGGTLTYFDRAFRVGQAAVSFNPADGVLPDIHAVANTSVVNPDPDRARNPYGSADVTISVDGPIAGLKIGITSNPGGYTRDQILALIAPFGGFVSGIAFSRQAMLARQDPNGISPLGAVYPVPNVSTTQSSTITVGQEAFNILNAQFTAGLLAPLESTLGEGLGLSSVNLTLGYYGNVGVTATRLLGKTVSAVYAVTFGLPQIQSFGLALQPAPETTVSLNFFYQSGPTKLLDLPGSPVGYGAGYLNGEPLIGNSGFSLTAAHYFW